MTSRRPRSVDQGTASTSKDILRAIQGHLAEPRELEQVLLTYYGRGRNQTHTEAELIRLGETDTSLRVVYSKSGAIRSLVAGPTFAEADTVELRALVNEKLLVHGAPWVGCSVLFSPWPLHGWFRYRDWFQILPVPAAAPNQEFGFGNNPLQVEVKFNRSSDIMINGGRLDRALSQVELLLSVFTVLPLRRINPVQKHWVLVPQQEGAAVLAQEGYNWPGREPWLDDFSDVSEVPPAALVPTEQYFSKWPGTSLELPSDLIGCLDAFSSLNNSLKERFLRAAFWVNHAGEVSSGSAMHVALVQAVEAVMPPASREACRECGKPKGDGPTAAFEKFVEQFSTGVQQHHRSEFYKMRSALTHGRTLHRWDVDKLNLSPLAAKERMDVMVLFRVVRIVLINWLRQHAGIA